MSSHTKFEQQNHSDTPGQTQSSSAKAEETSNEVRIGRRRFTDKYKRHILSLAAACKHGELGLLLRREGLYHGQIDAWRKQADAEGLDGTLDKKRGRKVKPVNPLQSEVDRLVCEVTRLTGQLKQAQAIINVQKKVSEMLNLVQLHGNV